jgi:hypothetical protein
MPDEIHEEEAESLRLPRNWPTLVRSAVLQVIGIVRIAMLTGREALIKNGAAPDARIHQLESEVAMLREELRINSARMRRVLPSRRPQYTGLERMAILQLRAMRGWNKSETSRHFLVSDDTIRDWLRRVDDDALVQTSTPVNRFPDVVRYAVQQIKLFCPTLGKLKIAEKLARAGMPILSLARFGRGKRMETAKTRTQGTCAGVSDGAREEKVERRPQASGERRSEFVWLSSLLSPLSCSIAARRQWRRPRRLETGIENRPPRGTRSRSIDMGFPSSNSHSLPDGEVATHGCSAS